MFQSLKQAKQQGESGTRYTGHVLRDTHIRGRQQRVPRRLISCADNVEALTTRHTGQQQMRHGSVIVP
jgi:hypothetical protein